MEEIPVILAAGKGTRMWPLTSTRPKPSLPVGGEPLICRHIRILSDYYDEILVVVGYKREKLVDTTSLCSGERVKLYFVEQLEEKGTGHALLSVLNAGINRRMYLIVHGDVFVPEKEYRSFIEGNKEMAVARVSEPWNYGVIKLDGEIVTGIVEKPEKGTEPSDLIYAGLLRIELRYLELVRELRPSVRGEIEIVDVIQRKAGSTGLSFSELKGWLDVGRPWELLLANQRALDETIEHGCGKRPCGIRNDSYGGEILVSEVKPPNIDERAIIEGPAYLGPAVTLRPYSYLRPYNSLMEKSLIGSHVEIKNTIVLEHAKVPHLSYIGDSVIGEHANLGAGTITANFRFDGGNIKTMLKGVRVDTGLRKLGAIIGGYARTGVNVSLLPGVKIGAYTWIYPGCTVYKDVPDNVVLKCVSHYEVKKLEK